MTVVRAVTLGAAIAFAGAVAAAATTTPAAMDFIAQYAAARLVITGDGASILDPAAVLAAERAAAPERERLLPFVQPPAVALLLAPLASLPFTTAFVLMAIVDVAIVVAALAILRPRGDAPLAVALLLLAPPAVVAVAHAQTSPLALLLVALAMRAGPRAGGFALGLTLLRPQNAPLLVLTALLDPARRWWAALGSLAVAVASAAVVGPDGLWRYAIGLVAASDWSVTGEQGLRTSIGWSAVALWLGVGPIGLAASVASLALGAVAVVRAPAAERAPLAAAWSLVASPHALLHDAVLAYPALRALSARRALWDVASVAAWTAHVLVAPIGVLWSLVLAARGLGYPRRAR